MSLPAGTPAPPRLAPAAARTPSPLPSPVQAPALTALVSTAPSGTPQQHARHRRGAERRFSGRGDAGNRPPHAQSPTRPHAGSAAARPARPRFVAPPGPRRHHHAHPARPARPREAGPRQAQPRPTYDLRTVCGWSRRSPVPPSVRQLCDAYVG